MLAVSCLVLPASATARGIHYGAVTNPEILNCDQMHWRGETEQSRFCYAELLRSTTPAAAKAEAAWALSNLKQANEWFRVAMAESPDDHATKVRWGDLFAASHQNGEAMNIYREVLVEDPGNAFAMLGAARVLVDSFEDAANSYLEPLMTGTTLGDGALLGAWLLVARVSLENGNYDRHWRFTHCAPPWTSSIIATATTGQSCRYSTTRISAASTPRRHIST
jgi:tetratricopeptide (TPR) repeat protein